MSQKILTKRWRSSSLLNEEMYLRNIDRVRNALGEFKPEDMPFNNMFGGQWRIMIPMSSPSTNSNALALKNLALGSYQAGALEQKDLIMLREAFDFLEDVGWSFNLSSGMAERIEKQTNPNTGETVDREIEMKIGKAIARLPLAPERVSKMLQAWSNNAELFLSANYVIILSQHPIDVLRMSDFGGIQSCHSQGGDYFECAIEEAKGHGPIAYLISNKEYAKIKDRLQDEEVFDDRQRGVAGATPIARVRIREVDVDVWSGSKKTVKLPLPERVVYGTAIPGFREKIVAWCKSSPAFRGMKTAVKKGKVIFNDLTVRGGSYGDSSAREMMKDVTGHDLKSYLYDVKKIKAVVRRFLQTLPAEVRRTIQPSYDFGSRQWVLWIESRSYEAVGFNAAQENYLAKTLFNTNDNVYYKAAEAVEASISKEYKKYIPAGSIHISIRSSFYGLYFRNTLLARTYGNETSAESLKRLEAELEAVRKKIIAFSKIYQKFVSPTYILPQIWKAYKEIERKEGRLKRFINEEISQRWIEKRNGL